jgi:hypothetical protein
VLISAFNLVLNPALVLAIVFALLSRHRHVDQNNVRELLQTLDVWFAAFFAIVGVAYRIPDPNADPASTPVIGGLLIIKHPGLGFDVEAMQTGARLLPYLVARFAATAVGQRSAELRAVDQHHCHFTAGQLVSTGLYQILAIILATAAKTGALVFRERSDGPFQFLRRTDEAPPFCQGGISNSSSC